MITPLLLVLCPMLQDLAGIPRLEPGVEVRGQLVDQPLEYRFRVEVDGPVHLDLQSLFFDARLELRAVDGSLLGEADEGSIGRHARLEVEAARKGTEYRVLAMAQDGGTGDFSLVLVLGAAPQLDAIAKEERTLADAKARVAAVAERFGERSAELADALYALGWTLYLGDRLEESVASYERSLAIREELFGRDAPVTLTTTDYLALALHAMSRHAEAEALYRRSLNARLRDLETDDRMIAYSAFNLAQQLKF
ncbi:MAG TPA: tetratricopeptide repeat protein, partial [Planctomycetota bacterium]